MTKSEEDVYDFDIEIQEDHVLLTGDEMEDRRREERKSKPLAEKTHKKSLDSRVQEIMEFTRQSVALTVSDAMPQKTVTRLKMSTQSSSNHLGAFEDTLMEDAEKVPSGSETTPFPRVELSNEGTLDTRHALAGASELTNKQEVSTLGDMGDADSLSLLSAVIHKPAAVDIVSDATAKVKSCPDSVPESPDQSGQMAPSMNTANDKYRQCVNGAHLPFGDDAGMRSMEKQLRSMPETFAISPETLLTLVNTPSLNSLELTIGVDRFDQLEDFQNRKVNADATKNVSDDAGDKFLKDQVSIPDKKLELLEKQSPEHDLGVVSSGKNTTCKQGTVSGATRRRIQQLERELTTGTFPERHVSRKSKSKHEKHTVVEESPPPPPGTHQVYHMLSSQNTVPPLRDKGIDDNGGLELSDLQEELSRAKEQICMLEACLKQSQEDSTCQDGEKWKSGSNNETEVLIQGYQKENERLVEKLKELKMQHENEKLSLYEERRQLGCQLNLLRNQVARQSSGKGDMSTNAESLRCQLALEAKVLRLQEQLEQEKKESAVLKSMGMNMKPIQQPLEDELASTSVLHGIPEEDSKTAAGENSSQFQLETTAMMEVRSLQDEISLLRCNHETEVAELKQKMQWYVENGELVDKHVERLAEQDKEIERLKCARAESSPRSSKSCSRCVTSSKTIAKLKAQLMELENASMKRNPDNVSSMIRAVKLRSDSSQKETSIRKINALEKELEKAKEDGIVRLRALRQEHERVCAGLRKRLMSEVNKKTDEKENFGGTRNNVNSLTSVKPSHDEREELVRMQQFYKKKLRKAEQKIMLQTAKIRRLSFGGGSTSTSPQQQQQQEVEVGAPASSEDKKLAASPSKKAKQSTYEERIAALEEKLTRTTEELCSSKATIDLIAASAASEHNSHDSSAESSVARKEGGGVKYSVHDSEPIHQPSYRQAQRKKVAKVSRIPVPQAAARSFSGLTDSPRLIASEETCKALRHQVTELQKEISDFKAREKFHSLPIDIKCDVLAEQLNAVQRRAEARSLEVTHAVDSVRNDARIEMATVQAKHKVELQSKAAKIDALRRELDELISHLGSLKVRSTVTRAPG